MKITKVIQRELGIQSALAPTHKHWILTAGATALSLGSSLFGASKAAEAARRAEEEMKRNKAKTDAALLRKMNENYADTAAGQNLINRAKEYAREQSKKAEGAKAVAGGTDAAVAMAKEQGNKMVGNTIADMAAQDTARKDAAQQQQIAADNQYTQQKMAIDQQKAQATTDAAGAASNALMSIASAVGGSTKLGGGSNNGVPVGNASDPNAAAAAMARGIKW